MITINGIISFFISFILILNGFIADSKSLLILGFALLFFFVFLFLDFYSLKFSRFYSKYYYYPFAYVDDKIIIRLIIDLKKDYNFSLDPYYPLYVEVLSPIDTRPYHRDAEYSIDIKFKKKGRYRLPFPKIKIYDKNNLFYRSVDLKNDQLIFVKKKTPPLILNDKKTQSNLNKIGVLHSKERMGDDDFKQLRDYVPGDDFRKIEWKSTARKSKLIVKEAYSEGLNNFFVIVDVGRNMDIGKNENILNASVFATENLIYTLSKTKNYLGFSLFDENMLRFENGLTGKKIVHTFHDSLISVTGTKQSNYIDVFKKIGRRLTKRSLIIIISNLQTDLTSLNKALNSLLRSRHKLFVLYPFEPTFEDEAFTNLHDRLIYDSLLLKYEDDYAALENLLRLKSVRVKKFGPKDYNLKIINMLDRLHKKEF
jgi:uncharacterized protein (DUF58 family)